MKGRRGIERRESERQERERERERESLCVREKGDSEGTSGRGPEPADFLPKGPLIQIPFLYFFCVICSSRYYTATVCPFAMSDSANEAVYLHSSESLPGSRVIPQSSLASQAFLPSESSHSTLLCPFPLSSEPSRPLRDLSSRRRRLFTSEIYSEPFARSY